VRSRSIHLSDVHKSFGEGTTRVHALRGMSLEVPAGQMCAIMGPSGSGKSTVLHLAAGLLSPDAGTVRLGDRLVSTMSSDELSVLRRREIGIVFQFFNLLPYLTAEENVALPLRLDGVGAAEERDRVQRSLELVQMTHRRAHQATDLSGGEMQRVAIARALAISPSVILADEPTGNLDSVNGRQIIELLRDINEQVHVTTLVVTHDPVWGSFCDRIVRMSDGQVTEDISLNSNAA